MMKTMTQWPKNGLVFEVPGKVRGKGRPRFTRRGNFVSTYIQMIKLLLMKNSYRLHI